MKHLVMEYQLDRTNDTIGVDRLDSAVIEKSLYWLDVSQRPSSHWSYQYFDEWALDALIGAVLVISAMAVRR